MRKLLLGIVPALTCLICASAHANWQYPGTYVGDGWYDDDGSRFVLSVRGGASFGFASIKNDIGALTAEYYVDVNDGTVWTRAFYLSCVNSEDCSYEDLAYAGMGNVGDLSAAEDFSEFSFAGGASIGWTIPNRPQWRVELGWDHITEMEYNQSPLFDSDLTLSGGVEEGMVINAQSGSAQSKVSSDIISIMAFYDFFKGVQKPVRKMIPYVGFGVGYADTKTTLNLSDLYGDLSLSADLQGFGKPDENVQNILQFYKSEKNTSNIAGLLAAGVSYGITETMFLDFGARMMWLPRVKWTLTNADDSRTRDWFSAENMIYANVMLGLRFEF